MNISTIDNSTCIWTSTWSSFTDTITYLNYTAIPPVFFILGVIGHLVALVTFIKHRKSDTAYSYQVFVTVIKTYEILAFDLWIICFFHFAGQDRSVQKSGLGWIWFKKNYILMWVTSKVINILQSVSITLPLLATTAMAMDRFIGLWKPIFYKSMNTKKQQTISYILCCTLALLSSLDLGFRFDVIAIDDQYQVIHTNFFKTTISLVTSQFRNVLRIVSVIVLIFSSVSIIFLHRAYLKKKKLMTTTNNLNKQLARSNRKMIFTLAIFHSISTAVPQFLLNGYSIVNYLLPTFAGCDALVMSIFIDFILQLINAIDFYILLFCDSQFKNMVMKLYKRNIVSVAPNELEMRAIPKRTREQVGINIECPIIPDNKRHRQAIVQKFT